MSHFKLSFAKPQNGWLPTTLEVDCKIIEFCASDVPNNPIEELIYCLSRTLNNIESSVWWHLEPAGYFFYFKPDNDRLQFIVTFSKDSNKLKQDEVITILYEPKDILLPLWRGLKMFTSYNPCKPDWCETSLSQLTNLGKRIKAL